MAFQDVQAPERTRKSSRRIRPGHGAIRKGGKLVVCREDWPHTEAVICADVTRKALGLRPAVADDPVVRVKRNKQGDAIVNVSAGIDELGFNAVASIGRVATAIEDGVLVVTWP